MKTKISNLNIVIFFGDLILLNLAFAIGFLLKFHDFNHFGAFINKYFQLQLLFNFIWLLSSLNKKRREHRVEKVYNFVLAPIVRIFIHFAVLTLIFFLTKEVYYSREMIFYTYTILIVLLVLFRIGHNRIFTRRRILGKDTINIVVIGYNSISKELLKTIRENPKYGLNSVGFFTNEEVKHDEYLGKIKDFIPYVKKNKIEEVFCTLSLLKTKDIQDLFLRADNELIRFRLVTDLSGIFNREIFINSFEKLSIVSFREEPLDQIENKIIKRIFDIVFSFLVIFLIFPLLFPIIIILIKLDSKGPIFFKQERSGMNNETFLCYKFRSMTVNSNSETVQTVKNDSRVTEVGAILRKTNLDEFPQFFNVLLGNMSIVGPRPHMVFHTKKYKNIVTQYMARHYIKPGITGLAQVNGFRGETKQVKQMEDRINADIYYIENWSLFLDIKIIGLTIYNMFKGEKNAF